jgi:glycosyltransferase involved in cell wall biosynthesis
LILAYNFPPENISGAKRPFRFAKYLPCHGYDVEVISTSGGLPGWDNVHMAPAASERGNVLRASRTAEFVQRHFWPYNDRLPWVPYAVARAKEILAKKPVHAVLSTSPPIGAHLAAAHLKRQYQLRWIADFRDPLYGNPWRRRRVGTPYDVVVERFILSNADAVITNTDTAGAMLRERYPRWASKISVLWNGYDPDDHVAAAPIPSRGYRLLSHLGVIGGVRHPALLLDSMQRLIERRVVRPGEVRIQLVGPLDTGEAWVGQSAFHKLLQQGCLEYTGSTVPESNARALMAQADYLLLLDLNQSLQVPAKLYDYIRVGRPVLAFTSRRSPTETILANSGVAHTCIYDDDSPERIDQQVLAHLALLPMASHPAPWFHEQFAAPAQTARLRGILDSALHN